MFLGEMDDIEDPLSPKVPSCAQGMRILLVDRDTTSLMFMASILEAYSYKVTTIEILSIAMAIYDERKDEFDVIMANVHVNNKTDLELVREIIKKQNTPIILMSTASPEALKIEAKLEGACLFWKKPLSNIQLRAVWQQVYRFRIAQGGDGKKINGGSENEDVQTVVEEPPMTRKCVGIQIREGGAGCMTTHENEFPASDGKGKNNQVVVKDALSTETELLRTMEAADQNQRSGDRKRGNEGGDDMGGGRRRHQRRISTPELFPSMAGIFEKNQSVSSQGKQGLQWSKELHFKFTAAISKLGEEKATPKAIQELMNVPNLSRRQIADELEKYNAQVQLIMDACRNTPPYVWPSRNVALANVTGRAGVPPLQPPPPFSPQQPRPNYSGPGSGKHQGIVIRERPPLPLPTPFTTNAMQKGKQVPDFQGNSSTSPYFPLGHYWQNLTPSPTFTRISEAGASSSANPPSSNLPAGASSTTIAGAYSVNPNISGGRHTGNAGGDDSDDLAFLTDWLSRSLKADDGGSPNFDWMDIDIP